MCLATGKCFQSCNSSIQWASSRSVLYQLACHWTWCLTRAKQITAKTIAKVDGCINQRYLDNSEWNRGASIDVRGMEYEITFWVESAANYFEQQMNSKWIYLGLGDQVSLKWVFTDFVLGHQLYTTITCLTILIYF